MCRASSIDKLLISKAQAEAQSQARSSKFHRKVFQSHRRHRTQPAAAARCTSIITKLLCVHTILLVLNLVRFAMVSNSDLLQLSAERPGAEQLRAQDRAAESRQADSKSKPPQPVKQQYTRLAPCNIAHRRLSAVRPGPASRNTSRSSRRGRRRSRRNLRRLPLLRPLFWCTYRT